MNAAQVQLVKARIQTFGRDEDGATAVEYGLIAGLIAVAIIVALTTLGGKLSTMFSSIASTVDAQATKAGS
ncbi:Flp family type IVb pilin [Robbsia andropogonis]|uniref:Flp family type IVb pilin n=1 Tax=Robbsia andropogonis TaxID=28092 RepID=UPI0004B1B0A3|nr:Flp family type IVb pilin [Robbsia andropogonis]MCP1117568.1 Flp family type IVb pilin [Robbsia andropogonis]MCP1127034.1 Flp family type IVb pilin [Robbsia andropogonis]